VYNSGTTWHSGASKDKVRSHLSGTRVAAPVPHGPSPTLGRGPISDVDGGLILSSEILRNFWKNTQALNAAYVV